ncbi:hypothetical protein [Conexibacter arvalis]|uniref:Uncharacterized protein n=1 Tax=Conexibacter arvalis TaxID=912552 RepID=A0A840IC20_9ACTN|nr:hypothetical protein [Conexibacter arvalis]MBB4662376.1 hypothetical protein [Conexibacter arvalis]
MSRARIVGLLASGAAVCALGGAQSAAAETRVVPLTFAGADCRSVAVATYRLPAAARLAYATAPVVGARIGGTKGDAHPRGSLARVTAVEVRGRTLAVTVAADPARCLGALLPGEPVDGPWTAALDANVSFVVPDLRWARRQTTSTADALLDPAYAGSVRSRCRRAGQARFSCAFSAFVGDSVVVGRGKVSIGGDDEWPRYSFGVRWIDEYCHAVLRRPLRRCLTTDRWRA